MRYMCSPPYPTKPEHNAEPAFIDNFPFNAYNKFDFARGYPTMNNLLCTYALIRSLYDQGEDYIDSFWPFAIQVLDAEKYSDTSSIQKQILDRCGISIPLHVLGTILKRARRKEYLQYNLEWSQENKRELYKLTPKGVQYLDKLENQEDVERRINDLLVDIAVFFGERNIALSNNQILDLLLNLLRENSQPLVSGILKGSQF